MDVEGVIPFKRALTVLIMISVDLLVAAGISTLFFCFVSFVTRSNWHWYEPSGFAVCLVLLELLYGSYPSIGLSNVDVIKRIFEVCALCYAGAIIYLFVYLSGNFLMVVLCAIAFFFLSFLSHYAFRSEVYKILQKKKWWGIPVVIFGAGKTGKLMIDTFLNNPALGYRPVAAFDDSGIVCAIKKYKNVPILKGLKNAKVFAKKHNINFAIVAMPGVERKKLLHIVDMELKQFPRFILIPDIIGLASITVRPWYFTGVLGVVAEQKLLLKFSLIVKRFWDLVITLVMSLIAIPFFLILVITIKLDSPGPALYSQTRVGKGNTRFKAWKFRSMVKDADKKLKRYIASDPEIYEEWTKHHKLKKDPRVTRVGKILRALSIDEVPQIWNIIRGEMSLIGPRPIVEEEIPKYGDKFEMYNSVKPGLTGLWQVSGRSDTGYKKRVDLDVYYVRNWSLWLDLFIFIRTPSVFIFRKGAY